MAEGDCGACEQIVNCNAFYKGDNAVNIALRILCAIATNTAGSSGGSGVSVVQSCLIVTTAGAWGSVDDIINAIQFFDTTVAPPVLTATVYFNVTTQAVVTGVTAGNTAPCPDDALGTDCDTPLYTKTCADAAGAVGITSLVTTAGGTLAAGSWSASFMNVGTTDASVNGAILGAGKSVNYTGYVSHVGQNTQTLFLPAIPYDPLTSTLRIEELA